MAVTMNARWDNNGTVIPGGDAEYVVAEQPIAEYDNWFNHNIVADVQAVIDDVINKFNANTILKADSDNTPAALAVGTNTIVGRAAGTISALSDSDVRGIIDVAEGSTKYPDTGEQAFLDADHTKLNGIATDATKYPDTGEQAFLDADHTKLNGVASGADVTGDNAPQPHESSHLLGGADRLLWYEISDDVYISNDPDRTTQSTSYVKIKEIVLGNVVDTIRIIYNYRQLLNTIDNIKVRVYRNGVAVGTEIVSNYNDGGLTYSQDISGWSPNDLLQVYGYTTSASGGRGVGIKDFRVLGHDVGLARPFTGTNQDP